MIQPHPLRVLCADDNTFVLDMLAKTLESAGHHVEIATDGRAAVTRVAQDPSYFQLIVTDTRMPRLDGFGVVVRGIGPSLIQFGLSNVLADPTLELRDSNGALLIANDNWQDDPASAEQLTVYGLAPADPKESAIFATLSPGAFTAVLAGMDGGIGLALLEIYSDVHGDTLTVTSTADSGAGSLRNAIGDAGNGDTIHFASALNGQTIALTSAELVIDKNITISGPGSSQLTVRRSMADGTPGFRILHVTPGHIVTIEGLTIMGGYSFFESGGGVFNDRATLTVNDCLVTGNFSGVAGGGFYSSGTSARLTVLNSEVSLNFASGIAQGGGGSGGGISSDGTLTITRSTVSGNSVTNQPPSPGSAGGIFSGGPAVISDSAIGGNAGGTYGGGIINGGPMTITGSIISGNTSIGSGAGIANGGTLTITNSTIIGNAAIFKQSGRGGGISNGDNGTLTIIHSTFSGNRADGGAGGIDLGNGTLHIGNTILKAGASGSNLVNNSGTLISDGYNLSSDNGGGFLTAAGDQINTEPMLGPFQDNGGPTFTHALLSGSPAINAGDPNFTPPPSFDQRGPGYNRAVGGRIDIGSFEVQP
jgi:Response regulator receiver domain